MLHPLENGVNEPNEVIEVRSLDKCQTTKARWVHYGLSSLKDKLF